VSFIRERPHFFPAIIAGLFLFIAVAPLPYGYFQVLRWVVCGIAVFMAYIAYLRKQICATVTFSIIAILFNPIFVVAFKKEVWQPIDIACGAMFIASILFIRKSENTE